MTDMHCHILPGVDDGAADLSISLEMARMAAASGVDTMIATPHYGSADPDPAARNALICSRYELLRGALRENGIPIELYLGAELGASEILPERVRDGVLPTLNGSRYLLCEFHFDEPSLTYMDRILCGVLQNGGVPILAHPERYEAVSHDPRAVLRWVRMGIGIQVNKASINGLFGARSQNAVFWMLDQHLVTAVATDCHDLGPNRASPMDELRKKLVARVGEEYTHRITHVNQHLILADRPIIREYF